MKTTTEGELVYELEEGEILTLGQDCNREDYRLDMFHISVQGYSSGEVKLKLIFNLNELTVLKALLESLNLFDLLPTVPPGVMPR